MRRTRYSAYQDAGAHRPRLRLDHVLAAVLLAVMVLVSFVNVLGRYLFHYSLAFTEELTVQMFVLLTVVGSALAFGTGSQLGMQTVWRYFPPRLQRICDLLSAGLSTVLFLAVDFLLIRNIHSEITRFHARSAALNVPVWIYYALVVLLSPLVFRGIWRGLRTRNAQMEGV